MKFLFTFALSIILSNIIPAQSTYWWNDKVFYEIFVRSYYDDNGNGIGDFKGLTKKLDYLNDGKPETTSDLGITALWLMPITESPSYHGYDVTDYRKIEQDYGTNADFKAFVDSAHARGIKVIIDLVLNHSASNNPWFLDSRSGTNSAHRNWYRWSVNNPGTIGPWGQTVWHSYGGNYFYGLFNSGMPDLNYFEPEVKNEVASFVKFWLDTVKVDGFRLDAVKYICEEGSKLEDAPSTFAYLREFRILNKGINPDALSVGEAWSSTSKILPYVDGTGLDFCFEFDTATDIINAINRNNPATLSSKMKDVITKSYPFLQYGTFLTNHDQTRIFSQLGFSTEKSKLAASILMSFPGVPFMYYGEEIGMTSGSDDPSKRTPMQWTPGTNAGFTTGTPWRSVNSNYQTNNVETMSADNNSLLNHYKKLIKIREQSLSLRRGKYFSVAVTTPGAYIFIRNSSSDNDLIIPVLNFNSNEMNNPFFYNDMGFTGMARGTYKLTDLLTHTDAGTFTIQPNGYFECTPSITLPAYGSAILRASIITSVENENILSDFNLKQNYPNPFNPSTRISFQIPESGKTKLTVYNSLGQEVKTILDQQMDQGYHSIEFNGEGLNSGIYIYKLESGEFIQSKKMILLK